MRIKVTAVPPGEAPEEIRADWQGLILPVDNETPTFMSGASVLTGRGEFGHYYLVQTRKAIRILREKGKNNSADWWQNWLDTHPMSNEYLYFSQDICRALPKVSLAHLHLVINSCIAAADENEEFSLVLCLEANHVLWQWIDAHALINTVLAPSKKRCEIARLIQPFWGLLRTYGIELKPHEKTEILTNYLED